MFNFGIYHVTQVINKRHRLYNTQIFIADKKSDFLGLLPMKWSAFMLCFS